MKSIHFVFPDGSSETFADVENAAFAENQCEMVIGGRQIAVCGWARVVIATDAPTPASRVAPPSGLPLV